MKKKSFAAILAMMMLLSSVSCSNTTNKGEETTPTNSTPSNDNVDNTEKDPENLSDYELRQLIPDELPDTTFGGKDFRVLTAPSRGYEIFSEELTGDACNDAIYNRNLDIEQRFEVKITTTEKDNPWSELKTIATSGTNDFELVSIYNYLSYTPINAKAVLNWTEVPHVNLSKPWHNELANNNSTINGKLYTICSDLGITSMTYTHAFFFNIDKMAEYGYSSSDLYSMVKEGKWTIDKAMEMTEPMYEDTNGDGKRDKNDVYGFGYQITNPADVWLAAFDQPICSIVDGKSIEITFMTDKTVSILEKLNTWHFNNPGVFTEYGSTQYEEEKFFLSGNLVMAPLRFYAAYNTLREMEAPYSILPYPKWDEAQERYCTNADDKFAVFALPITVYGDLDYIGTIYEALCAESYKKVYPEYYDTALKGKYSAEPETAEMVDLIMTGRNFDISFQFGESHFQRLPYMIRDMLNDKKTDLASKYKRVEKAITKNVKNKLNPLYEDK